MDGGIETKQFLSGSIGQRDNAASAFTSRKVQKTGLTGHAGGK